MKLAAQPNFDSLVRANYRPLYNYAYRLAGNRDDAEDLMQETLMRAYRFFDRYVPSRPFANWVFRIMHNEFVGQQRRTRRAKLLSLDQPRSQCEPGEGCSWEVPDESTNPEVVVLRGRTSECVQAALDKLPWSYREVIVLADIEQLSYEEISRVTHVRIGTVRSRLHRGRVLLRRELIPCCHITDA